MPAKVSVVHKWTKIPNQGGLGVMVVDTTRHEGWERDLSPFFLGPCELYGQYVALNVENAWQYAKVYARHLIGGQIQRIRDFAFPGDIYRQQISSDYWDWAITGWSARDACRYPMGRGAVPEFSLWDGRRLGYVEARKVIYGPLFAEAVQQTAGWQRLVGLYNSCQELILRDWDGWSMAKHKMRTLSDVLNNPMRKMGHAFVLKMLLEGDAALNELELRV